MRTKKTFAQILVRVHRKNMALVKDRAFTANRLSKITFGRSRRAAFAVKDKSLLTLLAMGEASILRFYGRPIGVQFRTGGQLHLRMPKHFDETGRDSARSIDRVDAVQNPFIGRAS